MTPSTTCRIFFDSLESAVHGLTVVLRHARVSPHAYRFGALDAKQIHASGLILEGDIEDIAARLEILPGAFRSDE